MSIDITEIVVAVIGVVVSVAAGLVARKLIPWLGAKLPATALSILQTVAKCIVYAVEAEYGSGGGKNKFQEALARAQDMLAGYHVTFNVADITAAIEEQWLKLNMEQLQSGMKEMHG